MDLCRRGRSNIGRSPKLHLKALVVYFSKLYNEIFKSCYLYLITSNTMELILMNSTLMMKVFFFLSSLTYFFY